MIVTVRDEEKAKYAAAMLREMANRIDAGEIMYLACTFLHTVEGGRKHHCAALDLYEKIEGLGLGEYYLALGSLRDFYLDAEAALRFQDEEKDENK